MVCFVFFGVLAVLGTAYLQTPQITPLAVWAVHPVGCLVTAILIVNNLRDIDTDRRVGKTTLAVRPRPARHPHRVRGAGRAGVRGGDRPGPEPDGRPWWWLPLLSLPLAVWLVRFVSRTEGRPLNQALKRTGQLHLVFGAAVRGRAVAGLAQAADGHDRVPDWLRQRAHRDARRAWRWSLRQRDVDVRRARRARRRRRGCAARAGVAAGDRVGILRAATAPASWSPSTR